MKRSKTLLVSNVLASLYSIYLLFQFGGAMIEAGGVDAIEALAESFKILFDLFGALDLDADVLNWIFAILILLGIHIASFLIGSLLGWISFALKKNKGAKFGATLYLIGTLCFPLFLFFGLPITIIGYIGASKQKKNQQTTDGIK